MLTAKDIMTADPITLKPEDDIKDAVKIMLDKKINGVPVVDDDNVLVGVLCQSDLVAQQKTLALPSYFTLLDGFIPLGSMEEFKREMNKISASKVEQAMTAYPRTVKPNTPLEEIATVMVDSKLYTLPVVDEGRLVGVVGKEDVLRTLFSGEQPLMKNAVVALALKPLLSRYVADFGRVLDLSLDSRAGTLSLDVLLKRETDPVSFTVDGYEILTRDEGNVVRFRKVTSSREWMNELFQRSGIREVPLPRDIPSQVLGLFVR